tara:strand:+ start:569 stop:970 length:402 start_codon:yes stop_codon:yes gene_type:complete
MKKIKIELPSNRKFGFLFSIVFALISLTLFSFNSLFLYKLFLILSLLMLLISLTYPNLLKPFNYLWMLFGALLGKIVSPIILGLIFFLMFSPISIISKLFGRDELNLRSKNEESLWKNREDSKIEPQSFNNQF